jgi:hypothetical protein
MKLGDVINKFTVIGIEGDKGGKIKVLCVCGTEKIVQRARVASGNTKSCGCWNREATKLRRTTHGEVRKVDGKRVASPEYRTWQSMRNRCLNTKSEDYSYYGKRGIKITSKWDTFEGFLADMGRRPAKEYTLERIDGDGDYCISNCRWDTRQNQARNRDYAKTKSWELAEILGVKPMTAQHYIWRIRNRDRGTEDRKNKMSLELELKVREFMREKGI